MAHEYSGLRLSVVMNVVCISFASPGCGDKPITQEALPDGWVLLSHSGIGGAICKPHPVERGRFKNGCPSRSEWNIKSGDFKVVDALVIGNYSEFLGTEIDAYFVFDTETGSVHEFTERAEFETYGKSIGITVGELSDE